MNASLTDSILNYIHSPDFLDKYPYYAGIIAQMVPFNDPAIRIMGVSFAHNRFYLHINAAYFANARHVQYLKGVLLHEVHHVVLEHLTHPKFQNLPHRDLLTLAEEMSANEYINEPLPGKPIVWTDYREFDITHGQSTMQRYDLLVKARQNGEHIPCQGEPVDDHIRCGLCEKDGFNDQSEALSELIGDLVETAYDRLDAETKARCNSKLAGKSPGHWLEKLHGTTEPPKKPMDWKTAIQMFAGMLRTPVHTYTRPNRRFPHLIGQVPGRQFFPNETENPNLLVAIDTSGSMSTDDLTEIARQLIPLSRVATITIVECDTKIHRTYRFSGQIDCLQGRGGTNLCPVFEPDFYQQFHTDGIIYFTDGYGPYPQTEPDIKTLWIITVDAPFGCPWGEQAVMTRQHTTAS